MISEKFYRSAVEHRGVLRVARENTICNPGFCMAGHIGLDNRDILPPFMPVQRGSDSIFGLVLQTCFRDSYSAHIPWAIHHSPDQPRRQYFEGLWKQLAGVQTAHVLEVMIRSFQTPTAGMDAQKALRRLGQYLGDLGTMPLEDFEEFLRIRCWEAGSWQISQMEKRIEDREYTPRWFVKYLEKYIEVVRESQPKPDYIIPQDLQAICTDKDQARRLSQELVRKYGELLESWPDIVCAARELKDKGRSLI